MDGGDGRRYYPGICFWTSFDKLMAAYKKYDPRVDSLVVETVTKWGDDIGELSAEDKAWVAHEIHRQPRLATHIEYERAHTGFTRIITVTADEIAQLYATRIG